MHEVNLFEIDYYFCWMYKGYTINLKYIRQLEKYGDTENKCSESSEPRKEKNSI